MAFEGRQIAVCLFNEGYAETDYKVQTDMLFTRQAAYHSSPYTIYIPFASYVDPKYPDPHDGKPGILPPYTVDIDYMVHHANATPLEALESYFDEVKHLVLVDHRDQERRIRMMIYHPLKYKLMVWLYKITLNDAYLCNGHL